MRSGAGAAGAILCAAPAHFRRPRGGGEAAAPRGRARLGPHMAAAGPPQRPGASSRSGFGVSSAVGGAAGRLPGKGSGGGGDGAASGGGRRAVRRLQKNSVHLGVSVAAGVPRKLLAHHPSNYLVEQASALWFRTCLCGTAEFLHE
eukprot:XP_027314431.1 zinc finger X-linked protein ZXDB isoform X2 [Anas platyrhynchos]